MTIPNIITAVRLVVLTPLFVVLAVQGRVTAAVVALMVLGLTDWADGYIARRWNQVSELGTMLDPLADRLGMGAVIITLAVTGSADWWMLALVVVPDAVLAVGMLFLLATHRFPLPELRVSPLGKARTALLMVGLPLLLLASSDQGGVLWTVAYAISAAGCVGHLVAATEYAWQAWHLVYRPDRADRAPAAG